MKHTHIHTLRHSPPFSQSAYTNRNDLMIIPSKSQITWNNAFSVNPKRKNSQIKLKKSLGSHIPNPPLESYHPQQILNRSSTVLILTWASYCCWTAAPEHPTAKETASRFLARAAAQLKVRWNRRTCVSELLAQRSDKAEPETRAAQASLLSTVAGHRGSCEKWFWGGRRWRGGDDWRSSTPKPPPAGTWSPPWWLWVWGSWRTRHSWWDRHLRRHHDRSRAALTESCPGSKHTLRQSCGNRPSHASQRPLWWERGGRPGGETPDLPPQHEPRTRWCSECPQALSNIHSQPVMGFCQSAQLSEWCLLHQHRHSHTLHALSQNSYHHHLVCRSLSFAIDVGGATSGEGLFPNM